MCKLRGGGGLGFGLLHAQQLKDHLLRAGAGFGALLPQNVAACKVEGLQGLTRAGA